MVVRAVGGARGGQQGPACPIALDLTRQVKDLQHPKLRVVGLLVSVNKPTHGETSAYSNTSIFTER